ncbi:lysophospholipase L1-like esterase [Arthrobacter sp. SORGH_AS 212]|uniref:SGNH/GDSL hydrolase family protein n=1 Tax=Pseudarthrobacter sp. SORGH_AS 212 TaxID=3041777 RepID=UPI00277DEDA4|nr:lysophospholipase L1-like esterase [Arthrobacter sp. SORGH_AS_0212]
MPYTYDPIFAQDPDNPQVVASNASITIYDPQDPAKTPIAITDPTGSPLPNPITVDARGNGPAFQHPTLDRVAWFGAGFTNYFTAYEGMKDEAVAARSAAQDAANQAAMAAADRVTAASVNGSGKLILTKGTGEQVDAGSVIGPQGVKGDKGADGANVLPTDMAIKQAITTPGTETQAALTATYGPTAQAESAPLKAAFVGRKTKTFMIPVADSNSVAGASARDFTQRTAVRFPKGMKRFWIRWANHNILTNTVLTSPMTITSFYVGLPAYDTVTSQRWTSNYAAAPTALFTTPLTVPTDGSDVEVGPFTLPENLVGKEVLLSYGITTQATGTGVGISLAGDGYRTGTASQAGTQTIGGSGEVGKIFGDLRFRVEVEGGQRIGLFIGDSLTAGFAAGTAPAEGNTRVGVLPHERWPEVAARSANFHAVNGGCSSAPSGLFATASNMVYTRLGIGTVCDVPDFAVEWLGANDFSGAGASAANLRASLTSVIATLRGMGIDEIYANTLTPQGFTAQQGTLTASAAAGATTITSSITALYTGQNMILGTGNDYEVATVTGQSGTGPYTLTLSAALTKAHPSGSRVAADAENIRLRTNNWLRQKPLGLSGVIPFDQFVTTALDAPSGIDQLMCDDKLHFQRSGYDHLGKHAAGMLARTPVQA